MKISEVNQLRAVCDMLAAIVEGAQKEFVKVPYGGSYEEIAAVNEWHKLSTEALNEWCRLEIRQRSDVSENKENL